jgi:hypothetical protein
MASRSSRRGCTSSHHGSTGSILPSLQGGGRILTTHRKDCITMEAPARYGLLRFIATILKILAWIVLIATVIGGFLALLNLGSGLGTVTGISSILVGVLGFLELYALGSILAILIDIERSTRSLAIQSKA